MEENRRQLSNTVATTATDLVSELPSGAAQRPHGKQALLGKRFGTIFNNDINNILVACPGQDTTPEEYQRAVYAILDMKPGVLAQNVGLPEAVLYRTSEATTFDKHLVEVSAREGSESKGDETETPRRQSDAVKALFRSGTDPLALTIEACRKRGVLVLASYRMNAEDWYQNTWKLSDFGQAHPEWRISGTGCLDPAVPQVYEHRMKIFSEVAERYDIDGIEFDFRRWYHMVSDPLKNHTVLTRMVRDTRRMLDEAARRKGRGKLVLGARVGPSLDTDPSPFVYPGIYYPRKLVNASCRDLGLDVKTWLGEGLVDYLCPALFLDGLPSLPKTREFAALAKSTSCGVYPTLWGWSLWAHGICERTISLDEKDEQALALFKDDLCTTALRMYEDGADGVSTFNWFAHLRNARMLRLEADSPETHAGGGAGVDAVQTYIYPLLRDPEAIRHYREQPWAMPPEG